MANFRTLRLQALKLPGVEEGTHMGGPAFRVRGKKFALWWQPERRTIMKLRPAHQVFLFEVRPEIFAPCRVGVGTWSYVDLSQLQNDEVKELVIEAWSTVAPKSVSRPFLAKMNV